MDIRKILNEMKVEAKFSGDSFEFENLGLAVSKVDGKMCTFVENSKYLDTLPKNVNVILTNDLVAQNIEGKNLCIVENPRLIFFLIHNFLESNKDYVCEDSPNEFGENVSIGKFTSIADKNVKIGNNVVIEDFVKIEENTTIMDNSIIRSGVTIGSQGYQYQNQGEDVFLVKHYGSVYIGKNVEVKNNSCIDKAIYPWDKTIISDNVKIDKGCSIAHGVKISKNTKIAAIVAISGRVEIGKNTWIGVGASIRNGINIGSNSRVNMGAVVTKSVKDGEAVSGNFAIDHNEFLNHIKDLSK